ncbi:terminal uridylyltransferase 7-like [Malaya genurostris]|uniref:terminal uridylyltransferase 7-like n=1 Tax=Malaya genurostris TaxID=325434 RepID=UPI0026F3D8A9|nr:terminal uridylyltransferase 7-like [Malaya genurostris]
MQELFLMNWEIHSLTEKLQSYKKTLTKIDIKTVSFIDQLTDTIASFLTNKLVEPTETWDAGCKAIFNNYTFSHTINCKHCGRSVRTTKPGLVKHLKEHNLPDLKQSGSSLPIAQNGTASNSTKSGSIGNKKGPASNSTKSGSIGNKSGNKKGTASNSTKSGSIGNKSNTDHSKKLVQNLKQSASSLPIAQNGTASNPTKSGSIENKKDTVSNSTKSGSIGIKSGNKKGSASNSTKSGSIGNKSNTDHSEELVQNSKQSNASNSSKSGSIENKSDTASKGSQDSTCRDQTDSKIQSSKSAKTTKDDNKLEITKKTPRQRRKFSRSRDGLNLESGCIPSYDICLSKKMTKFLGRQPIDFLKDQLKICSEIVNSSAHEKIADNLIELFKENFPKMKVYMFGSRITGLANKGSDLDLFLDAEDCYDGKIYSKTRQATLIYLLDEVLSRSKDWSKLAAVTGARTPILRARYKPEKIYCDISFANGLSCRNTMLIQYLFELQPIFHRIVLYLKKWANFLHIGGLNSYTITLLTMFYLQDKKLLPSVYDLQKDVTNQLYITHWRSDFDKKTLDELGIQLVPDSAVETYLLGFFTFYGTRFCFETQVVCTYLGWSPQKRVFDPEEQKVPEQMESLRDYYKLGGSEREVLAYTKPIVVQDPFDLIHNVAKGISPTNASKLRYYCAKTAQLLDEKHTQISNNNNNNNNSVLENGL